MPRRASTATDSACVCRGSRTARTLLVERGPAASRRRSDTVKLVIGSRAIAKRALVSALVAATAVVPLGCGDEGNRTSVGPTPPPPDFPVPSNRSFRDVIEKLRQGP